MENKSHAFWAGLFTIGLSLAVVATMLWFNADRAVRVPYDLIARTNVTGLSPDAAVRYRGLDVGKVQSIQFDHANPGQIVIRILVNQGTPITRSTYGSLGFQGVTGIAFVQLDDTGHDTSPLTTSAQAVAQIPMHPSLFDELQRRGDVLLRQLERVTADADGMLSPEMRDQLKSTASSLQHAADGIASLSKTLEPAAAQMPAMIRQADRTLALANALMQPGGPLVANLDKAGTAAQQAGVALASMNHTLSVLSERVYNDTLPRLDALAASVGDASRSLEGVADNVRSSPTSLLFGAPPAPPGPGEAGFVWPVPAGRP